LLVCSDMQFAPVLEFMAVRKRLGLDVRRFGVMLGSDLCHRALASLGGDLAPTAAGQCSLGKLVCGIVA
jgi:hypothetical protein